MTQKRRVFFKRPRRRAPLPVLFLSLAAIFASTPAAIPKTPPHPPASTSILPAP